MLQIIGVSLIGALIIIFLKSANSDMTMPTMVCVGVIILCFGLPYLTETLNFINQLKELTGISESIIKIIIKITAIGYLIEFAAGTIDDMGLKSLSDKLVFIGKIVILSVSLPILYSVINIIKVLIQ